MKLIILIIIALYFTGCAEENKSTGSPSFNYTCEGIDKVNSLYHQDYHFADNCTGMVRSCGLLFSYFTDDNYLYLVPETSIDDISYNCSIQTASMCEVKDTYLICNKGNE